MHAQKHDPKPWLSERWRLAPTADPAFVWHMEDVVSVDEHPYDPARPVVCLDETSRQLLADARSPLPPVPGRPARSNPEGVPGGLANLFPVADLLPGCRDVSANQQRTRLNRARRIRRFVGVDYPEAERVVLVTDRPNTHCLASLYAAFPAAEARHLADRIGIHHAPKLGSWLNGAEIEPAVLERRCPRQCFGNRAALAAGVGARAAGRNAASSAVDWRFTTADARTRLRRPYPAFEA